MKSLHRLSAFIAGSLLWLATATAAPSGTVNAVANPREAGWSTGSGVYPSGTVVTLTASASNGWAFAQWESGETNPVRKLVVKSGKRFYTANFTNVPIPAITYGTISLSAEPINGGTVTGAGTYAVGQPVTLNASPAANYVFVKWQDGITNSLRSIVVQSGTILMVATFSPVISQTTRISADIYWDLAIQTIPIKKYVVYWGISHGNYTDSISTTVAGVTLDNLMMNIPYFIAVKAISTNDIASPFSCEVVWQYPGNASCP